MSASTFAVSTVSTVTGAGDVIRTVRCSPTGTTSSRAETEKAAGGGAGVLGVGRWALGVGSWAFGRSGVGTPGRCAVTVPDGDDAFAAETTGGRWSLVVRRW